VIVRSPLPDVILSDKPFTEFVLGDVDDHSARAAFSDGVSGRTLTFGDVRDLVHQMAGGLAERGFAAHDVLALMAPNVPEYAVAFHAAAVAGGAVTTINPSYTAGEVHRQLAHSCASFLITTAACLPVARAAAADMMVRHIYVLDDAADSPAVTDLLARPLAQISVDPFTDVVALPYSSGTTGQPKGVMLTHHNLSANIAQCRHALPHADGDVALAVLPFFHIYGMQVLMNGPLAAGCTVVTLPRFDLRRALELIEQWRVTRFFVVPPIVHALATDPLVDDYDLSSLRLVNSGAAPLSAEVAARAGDRIGCTIVQGYGMTELSPVTHATPPHDVRPGSVGVTVSNAECRIVADGHDQPVGGTGELWVRGPMVMKGYLDDPRATAEIVDADGWLHTGDVGRFDAAGHLYIVDRLKELIKVSGFQVAPAELEAILLAHPAIVDAAVVGVPDARTGEGPAAFVVRAPHASNLSEHDVTDHVARSAATYKRLRSVTFLEAIPRSASGKILRRELRSSAVTVASEAG
jgi:4-coumarate--CoA ligase